MSDGTNDNNQNTTTNPPAPAPSGGGGGGQTFTQADLDRIVGDRLARERQKYADYDDLKNKAAAADASKTELQKLTEQVQQLQTDLTTSKSDALKADVAAAKGVPKNLLTGSTKEELEAAADALLEFRGLKPGGEGNGNGSGGGEGGQAAGGQGQAQTGSGGSQTPPGGKSNDQQHLRDGTVPGASGKQESGEDLAKRVFERARGGL